MSGEIDLILGKNKTMAMTTIASDKIEIQKSAEYVFNYLSNLNNLQPLMPEQVSNWSSTEEECSFSIKGMASIGLKVVTKTPHSKINLESAGKSPFAFTLTVNIESIDDQKCIGQLVFEAELNMFMKMMVEKPMQNFFNYLAHKFKTIS